MTTAALATLGSVTGTVGALFLPYVIGRAQEAFEEDEDFVFHSSEMSDSKQKLLIGVSIAALPISVVLAPVTMPTLAIATAMWVKKKQRKEQGDLLTIDGCLFKWLYIQVCNCTKNSSNIKIGMVLKAQETQ